MGELQQAQDTQRLVGLSRLTQLPRERDALRDALTPQHTADIFVSLCSNATYESLVLTRGWTDEQYEAWLARGTRYRPGRPR